MTNKLICAYEWWDDETLKRRHCDRPAMGTIGTEDGDVVTDVPVCDGQQRKCLTLLCKAGFREAV